MSFIIVSSLVFLYSRPAKLLKLHRSRNIKVKLHPNFFTPQFYPNKDRGCILKNILYILVEIASRAQNLFVGTRSASHLVALLLVPAGGRQASRDGGLRPKWAL